MRLPRLIRIAHIGLRYRLDELVLGHERVRGLHALAGALPFRRRLKEPRALRLRQALEELGPIFVKFGQILSTRRDLLPTDMADELASLLIRVRPHAKADIAELRRVLLYLNRPENQKFTAETLDRLPNTLRRQARIGSHGSWYNYYLCDFDGNITLPSLGPALDNAPVIKDIKTALSDMAVYSTADRCTP